MLKPWSEGAWEISEESAGWRSGVGKVVAAAGTPVARTYGDSDGHEQANARLIAAAPEMAEELRSWVDLWYATPLMADEERKVAAAKMVTSTSKLLLSVSKAS